MIVIADTTPINYLVLIGDVGLLPALFGQVVIPEAVFLELQSTATPPVVRQWVAQATPWLEVRKITPAPDSGLSHLDEGEKQAIQLAEELGADLLLVDEREARKEAAKRNIPISGTLGILDRAADKGLVDFTQALQRLKQTSFYLSSSVEQFFLSRDAVRKSGQTEQK